MRLGMRSFRSHKPVCGNGQPSTPAAAGAASASRIETLAPAFGQALPSLADVRSEYSHEVNAELVYALCAALVAPQTPRRRIRISLPVLRRTARGWAERFCSTHPRSSALIGPPYQR